MPHSVTVEDQPLNMVDTEMADSAAPTSAANDASQSSNEDIPMEEATAAPPKESSDTDSKSDQGSWEVVDLPEHPKTELKAEDLFDSDSDEDLLTSTQDVVGASSQDVGSQSPGGAIFLKASDPMVMRSFYQRLFPWRYLFQWLNHSPTPTTDFAHREFAFTLQNDAYLRYLSYPSSDLLRKEVLQKMPSRFEIGPVYTTNPRERKTLRNSSAFKPLAKELCFDIDLTDYDDIRTCCDKASICNKCWQFITMAIKVVDVALRDDFGFKHIMWVYSGRRGAHAWVCDRKARVMDDARRRAIAGYLEVLRGGAQSGKKVNVRRPLHPHVDRSLNVLKSHFQDDVLAKQDPWDTPERAEKLLALLPDRTLTEALRKKWDSSPGRSSASKWADIDALAKTSGSKGLDTKSLLEAKQDIVLEYTYPRLDIEVSKKLNHLLKSPFVVHPGTGRVCVPINTAALEDFDPLGVPTVQALLQEIDEAGEDVKEEESAAKPAQDWEKTSLKPYIEQFRSFVIALMKDEAAVKVKRERDGEGMDF